MGDSERAPEKDAGNDIATVPVSGQNAPNTHRRLNFRRDVLFGREEELRRLTDAYKNAVLAGTQTHLRDGEDVRQQPSSVVLVSGYSGTGKSSLVQRLREPVAVSGGQFLFGKFDQLKRGAEPYSALVSAFEDMCGRTLAKGPEEMERMKSAILASVGTEAGLLTELIPKLECIIGAQPEKSSVHGMEEAQNRFNFALRQFAKTTCTPSAPAVLVLDDVQWADEPSIDLIRTLVEGEDEDEDEDNILSLLVVLCYRENEVDLSHPLSFLVSDFRSSGVDIIDVKIENLPREDVNNWISEVTNMPPDMSQTLADVVYRKTQGNCLFVVQFLKSLCNENLLYFSASENRFRWHAKAISSKGIMDDVLDLMSRQIEKLPSDAQDVLKLAACIGSPFDMSTLCLVFDFDERRRTGNILADLKMNGSFMADSPSEICRILDLTVEEGLIDVVIPHSRFKFAHDRIQQAAYCLIPPKWRPSAHYNIGDRIWHNTPSGHLDKMLFVAVDQLNRGVKLVPDKAKQFDVAQLNLRAGKKAMSSAAFQTAAMYLMTGIDLLGQTKWKDHFELALMLHNAAAEVEYINGKFSRMEGLITDIFTHARSLEEKLTANLVHIESLKARMKLGEAMDAGLKMLALLGVKFPKSPGKAAVVASMMKTKYLLRRKSCGDLALLPPMEDKRAMAAMQVLDALVPIGYLCRVDLFPLFIFRMVQLSVRHGIHRRGISAYGFALYGLILCSVVGEEDEGIKFGQLALTVVENFKCAEVLARVFLVVFSFVNPWKHNIKESLGPLLLGYRTGMQVGDVEFGLACTYRYCVAALQCGRALTSLEAQITKYVQLMKYHKQDFVCHSLMPYLQFTENLLRRSENPVQLTGSAMDETTFLNLCKEQNSQAIECHVYLNKMKLAYFYDDIPLAAEMAKKSMKISVLTPADFEVYNHAYFEALIYCEMAQRSKQRKWRKLARRRLEVLRRTGKFAEENCRQKVLLVEAELYALKKRSEKASKAFREAIDAAAKHGFVSDEAMAHERAWLYFDRIGDQFRSSHHHVRAYNCYLKWGAEGKAEQLYRKQADLAVVRSEGNEAKI